MSFIGDYAAGDIIDFKFTSRRFAGGNPITLITISGSPQVSVYKSNSTTQTLVGVTLTIDFDALVGLNHVRIDTSADSTFYSADGQFDVVITAGLVEYVSVVGETVGRFTLQGKKPILSAIKTQTDKLAFTVANQVDANIQYVNDVLVTGTGHAGSEWGP